MAQLPIIEPESSKEEEIKKIVLSLLDAHENFNESKSIMEKSIYQQKIDLMENQLNQLVYQLYCLTREEIEIIENSYNI